MKKYEKGKYVNWVGSRGQETLRLGSEGCWSEGWVAAAPGPQNGHSEPHSYNIHMSRLQFARASVIKNVETHPPFVCFFFHKWELSPVTSLAEQWSRIGVYPAFMTRLKSLIGVVSPSMSGHLRHQHSLPCFEFLPFCPSFSVVDKIHTLRNKGSTLPRLL